MGSKKSVRINVTVPADVAETLKDLGGPRGQSSFIAKSVRYYAKTIKKKQFLRDLERAYQASENEDRELITDFDQTIADGLTDDE